MSVKRRKDIKVLKRLGKKAVEGEVAASGKRKRRRRK